MVIGALRSLMRTLELSKSLQLVKRQLQRHTELCAKCVCAESGHFERLIYMLGLFCQTLTVLEVLVLIEI